MSAELLEIGLHRALSVRDERFSTRHDACRLLYVSDIHLRRGRSELLCRQVIASVDQCQPDAVLLGGDLVDHRSELSQLSRLVRTLSDTTVVMAVAGNHDCQVGLDRVRMTVTDGGGHWIHADGIRLNHGSRAILVCGPEAAPPSDGDVRILCAHNPRIWKSSQHLGYDLVLAGHLHGCQIVVFQYRDRLFPGAFFYPNCCLSQQRGLTRLIVSRGVSDLVPIRWRCPREVILCHV